MMETSNKAELPQNAKNLQIVIDTKTIETSASTVNIYTNPMIFIVVTAVFVLKTMTTTVISLPSALQVRTSTLSTGQSC